MIIQITYETIDKDKNVTRHIEYYDDDEQLVKCVVDSLRNRGAQKVSTQRKEDIYRK